MKEFGLSVAFVLCWSAIIYIALKDPLGHDARGQYKATKLVMFYMITSTTIVSSELVILLAASQWFAALLTLPVLIISGVLAFAYIVILEPEARFKWTYEKQRMRYLYGNEALDTFR